MAKWPQMALTSRSIGGNETEICLGTLLALDNIMEVSMQRKMSGIRDQRGFTLIEIIMVIVLLGIIAAIAIPKYVDLKSEAVNATLNGLKGGMVSSAAIGYADIAIHSYTYANATYPDATDLAGSYLQSDDLTWAGGANSYWTAVVGGNTYTFTYYQASGGVDWGS